MATISVTIPNAILNRVTDGICGQYSYQATINGSPNPETKAQFAQRMVREFIKNTVKGYEATVAQDAARTAAIASADTDIVLT